MIKKIKKEVRKNDEKYVLEADLENNSIVKLNITKYIFIMNNFYNSIHYALQINAEKAILIEVHDNVYATWVVKDKEIYKRKVIEKLLQIADKYIQRLNDNDNNSDFDTLKQLFDNLFIALKKRN